MTNNTADNPAVLLERRGSIAYVTLNQPENRNTLSRHLATELREVLNRLHEDGTLKAAVLTGAGQDFSLGGSYDDFAEGMSREKEESLAYSRDLARLLEDIILGIVAAPIPFIAAINGQAAGAGMSLALACDLRVAEPRTKDRMRSACCRTAHQTQYCLRHDRGIYGRRDELVLTALRRVQRRHRAVIHPACSACRACAGAFAGASGVGAG